MKEVFQLPPVEISMTLASNTSLWCFSFHVPLTELNVSDSAPLAASGGERIALWC